MALTGDAKREYQRNWILNRKLEAKKILGGKCVKCDSTDRLEFDHINPDLKPRLHGTTSINWSQARPKLLEELKLCRLLCYDCHKARTKEQLTRQFCVKGHDTFKTPRKPSGGCRECARDYDRNARRIRAGKIPSR